jgi:hypothetical protein
MYEDRISSNKLITVVVSGMIIDMQRTVKNVNIFLANAPRRHRTNEYYYCATTKSPERTSFDPSRHGVSVNLRCYWRTSDGGDGAKAKVWNLPI